MAEVDASGGQEQDRVKKKFLHCSCWRLIRKGTALTTTNLRYDTEWDWLLEADNYLQDISTLLSCFVLLIHLVYFFLLQ